LQAKVRLFAVARERAGTAEITVDLPAIATVADLKLALGRDVPSLAPILGIARISVNHEYAVDTTPIPPDAELAVIPPVSGGED
jgi:molybdopterin converting factor subunit 1